jgi:hypothetical protein
MRKIVLTFGLIAGAIMSVLMVLAMLFQDQIGLGHSYVVGYTSMVIAFLMVFFGVKSYRDNVAGGSVKFGRAFGVGLLITLIATAGYVATWEVVYHYFMPDFMDKYAAYAVDEAKKSGATEASIAATEKQMAEYKEAYKNPLLFIAFTAIEPLPVGLLFTAAAAWWFSRKRREPGMAAT